MNGNYAQASHIRRCFRFMVRHHRAVAIESVARNWILRFAKQWRGRHSLDD